jgi:DNA primase large subunit
LKKLEQIKLRHVAPDKHKKHIDPLLQKLNDPTKDWISHFVLRLAYCRTEDLRRWFLAQEVALLKYRLNNTNSNSNTNSPKGGGNAIAKALKSILPNAHVLTPEELKPLLPKILAATPSLNQNPLQVGSTRAAGNSNVIYRVPFTQALDLVQHRQVFVKAGMAYIPESKLLTLVTAKFRTNLSRQLVLLSSVPSTPALQRTQGFLNNVATVHALKDEYANGGNANADGLQLNAHNVPAHLNHMPLCMAQLQMALTKEKHLKHWGRLQYGLFLKGAGLSLEDALAYFERMFVCKGFSKEYAYNFRHMYGKEGKRANYPPYNCAKVINSNAPNSNEHHGCPYKHSTVQQVSTMLNKLGIAPAKQKAIIAQQQSHNYQLACVEHFKAAHPGVTPSANDFGNHPNAWFSSSVKAAAESNGTGAPSKPGSKDATNDAAATAVAAVSNKDVEMGDPISVSP